MQAVWPENFRNLLVSLSPVLELQGYETMCSFKKNIYLCIYVGSGGSDSGPRAWEASTLLMNASSHPTVSFD